MPRSPEPLDGRGAPTHERRVVRSICALTAIVLACGPTADSNEAMTSSTRPADGIRTLEPSQLCIIRHAEAFKNVGSPPAGLTPAQLDSLTPNGQAQARALSDRLPRNVVVLASSPANRARQTASSFGVAVALEIEPALRPLDGATPWGERLAAWGRGEDPRPEGGESLVDGAMRARAWLRTLRARVAEGEHAVVVTHGDLASVLLGELRGTPLLERPTRDELDTGAMACLPLGH